MFHFYNNACRNSFNISSLFSSGMIIFSTGSCFTVLPSFDLVTASATFPLKYSPILWTTSLEAVFGASSPVSNNCYSYFLANDKNPYPLTYFIVLGSIEYCCIVNLEERVISIY